MIHLEPGHRIVADAVAMCVHSSPEKREAVDVRCSDFGCHYYVCAAPEEPHILRVSLWTRCFDAVQEQVGKSYFQEIYPGLVDSPLPEYKLTLRINLDELPSDSQEKGSHSSRICPGGGFGHQRALTCRVVCSAQTLLSGGSLA
eukprot:6192346-Pleurochrysis_carterae.AAC.3